MSSIKDSMYSPKEKNVEKLKEYLKKQDNDLFNIDESIKKDNNLK